MEDQDKTSSNHKHSSQSALSVTQKEKNDLQSLISTPESAMHSKTGSMINA